MIEKYPDSKQVVSGEAAWMLKRAYEYHRLYDEAIGIVESWPLLYPDHSSLKSGDCLYSLASSCASRGRTQELMQDKGAADSYRKAVAVLRQYEKKFPAAPHNKPHLDGSPSNARSRINSYSEDANRAARASRSW
jgi:hypothetical protein